MLPLLDEVNITTYGFISPGIWESRKDGSFEKHGIQSMLLPDKTYIDFARPAYNTPSQEKSQSQKTQLGWDIYDTAIDAINNHLAHIARTASLECSHPGLLIIDEIGPLELTHNTGITQALHMLEHGPTHLYKHTLCVMRPSLLEQAEHLYANAWGGMQIISPTFSHRDFLHKISL